MRRKLAAGTWKMTGTATSLTELETLKLDLYIFLPGFLQPFQ